MNRRGVFVGWLFFLVNLCAVAQAEYRPIVVVIRPAFDVPVAPDHLLFRPSGGASLAARYVMPFIRPLSIGPALTWHFGRLEHADLGALGSLSLVAGEATVEVRSTFRIPLDLYLGGGFGWFYAFLNGAPSQWVTNVVWSARAGFGYRLNPSVILELGAEYRRYETLYHFLGIGIGVDLRVGGR